MKQGGLLNEGKRISSSLQRVSRVQSQLLPFVTRKKAKRQKKAEPVLLGDIVNDVPNKEIKPT